MGYQVLMLLGILAGLLLIALVVLHDNASMSFVVWCLTFFFVPVWIGVSVGTFLAALSAVTILVLFTNLSQMRLVPADAVIVVFAVLVIGMFVLGMVGLPGAATAILEYVIPYVWGRVVLTRLGTDRLTSVLAFVATAAAALAIVEFLSGTNVFVLLPAMGPSYATWAPLQPRGGFIRAEGAFGHSIALGASLAMSSAFVHVARWRPSAKLASLAIITIAVVVTFSRIGLVTLGLTTALCLMLLRSVPRSTKLTILVGGLVASAAIIPTVSGILDEAGDEAARSAAYRSDLWSLIPQAEWLGAAQAWQSLFVDGVYLGRFAISIDNALIVMLLRYGIIPTAVVSVGLILMALRALLSRSANPATIAVIAQIPSLFSVALITQYGMFMWFLAGVAVSWNLLERQRSRRGVRPRHTASLTPSPQLQLSLPLQRHDDRGSR